MTGAYISRDGGNSWRMFNERSVISFFVFDPVDPNVIYCNGLGLMRSADGGGTWSLVFPDASNVERPVADDGESIATKDGSNERIAALAVDPANSQTLYAVRSARDSAAFHVSTDWGRTWKKMADLPGGGQTIYVDPASPKDDRTLYVIGTASVAVREGGRWVEHSAPEGSGVFRSVSGGFPAAGGKLVIYAIAGGRRGAGTSGQGDVFKSADGGAAWEKVGAGLATEREKAPNLLAVAACLADPDVAYISYDGLVQADGTYFGVAKTTDAGRTWQYVWKANSEKPGANVSDGWITERFGTSWGDAPRCLAVAPAAPGVCYGTDDGRTMRTTDGGKTWAGVYSRRTAAGNWSTTGLDVTTCYGVFFDPFDSSRVFIGYTDIGAFVSEDGGASWRSATSKGVPPGWVNTTYWMVFDPKVKGRVWAAMADMHDLPRPKMWDESGNLRQAGGVCASADGGGTWQPSNQGMPETNCTFVMLDPASPVDARVLYATGFGTGVWKSADGGGTWTQKNNGISDPRPFAWRMALDSKGTLYLILARKAKDGQKGPGLDGRLYRSTDGAETWRELALPDACNGPEGITIDPKDDARLYLSAWGKYDRGGSGGGGVFMSADAGATWRNVLSKDQHVYDVTVDPRDANVLYACGFESSAWRSADRGETWTRIKGFNFKWGHRVIPDPSHPGKIFIATYGGSVWYGPAQGDPSAKEDIVTPVMAYDR
jgi:hypothetical protein